MRLGCEGESATQPQFFVDTKELTSARLRVVFKPVSGFRPATRTIHEITLSCITSHFWFVYFVDRLISKEQRRLWIDQTVEFFGPILIQVLQ
jgi:hypothetical protein